MYRSDNARLIGPLERALFMKTLGPMEELSSDQIALFAEYARERSFREGDVIFERGRPVGAYHMIVEGSVHASGGEFLDGILLGARDPLGFLSMISQRPEGLEAVARADTLTLEIDVDVMLDILEENFSLLAGLIRRLAGRTLAHRQQVPNGAYLAPYDGEYEIDADSLDFVERLLVIRRPGSPFASSSMEAIARLARTTSSVLIGPGTTIWKSGDRADHALIIVGGTVSCTTQWGFSRFRAGPGYPLGNLERFSGDPRWFTAVTETPVLAVYAETEPFMDVLEDHTDMALGLAKAMAERLISIQEENHLAEQASLESESAA